MSEPPLHPLCAPVAFLLGEWRGDGRGGYPGMEPFAYREEMRVWHTGKPYLAFEQRTWTVEAASVVGRRRGWPQAWLAAGEVGRGLHAESGHLRCADEGRLELLVAMAPGHAEVSVGSVEGTRVKLASVGVFDAPSAAAVSTVRRTWWLDVEVLRYDLEMAALDHPRSWHLTGELRRVG